jgi:hypothetical protein
MAGAARSCKAQTRNTSFCINSTIFTVFALTENAWWEVLQSLMQGNVKPNNLGK